MTDYFDSTKQTPSACLHPIRLADALAAAGWHLIFFDTKKVVIENNLDGNELEQEQSVFYWKKNQQLLTSKRMTSITAIRKNPIICTVTEGQRLKRHRP